MMAKGGLRPGAGRKPGVRNKRTAEKVAAVEASGLTPLDYLLTVMRDELLDRDARVDAAKAAAPYVHARLAAVEHSTDPDAPMGFTFTWQQPSG
jgi:hypothetical protein